MHALPAREFEHGSHTIYFSMMSLQNEQIRTSMTILHAIDELHIMFSKEPLPSITSNLMLVLPQDEWPYNPNDQQHEPESPPPNKNDILSSVSESAPESTLESDDSVY